MRTCWFIVAVLLTVTSWASETPPSPPSEITAAVRSVSANAEIQVMPTEGNAVGVLHIDSEGSFCVFSNSPLASIDVEEFQVRTATTIGTKAIFQGKPGSEYIIFFFGTDKKVKTKTMTLGTSVPITPPPPPPPTVDAKTALASALALVTAAERAPAAQLASVLGQLAGFAKNGAVTDKPSLIVGVNAMFTQYTTGKTSWKTFTETLAGYLKTAETTQAAGLVLETAVAVLTQK